MLAVAFETYAAAESIVTVERPLSVGTKQHRLHGHAACAAGRASLRRLAFALRGAFEILPDNFGERFAEGTKTPLAHDPFGVTDPAVGLMHDRILALFR